MPFKIFLFGILSLIISLNSVAGAKEQSEDTLPFVIYKLQQIKVSSSQTFTAQVFPSMITGATVATVTPKVENLSSAEIAKLIGKTRAAICNSVGNADVKVWFSLDADGKILGIGMAAQSGLEVAFHCEK